LNFARNASCRRCAHPSPATAVANGEPLPAQVGHAPPQQGSESPPNMRPGDWICPKCAEHNYASKTACRRCATPKPFGGNIHGAPVAPLARGNKTPMPGDWYCPTCSDLQFARNLSCRKCGTSKPPPGSDDACGARSFGGGAGMGMVNGRAVKPGDWVCANCKDLQFARNTRCRRCNMLKPIEGGERERRRSCSSSRSRSSSSSSSRSRRKRKKKRRAKSQSERRAKASEKRAKAPSEVSSESEDLIVLD